jgi:hypothetical protein
MAYDLTRQLSWTAGTDSCGISKTKQNNLTNEIIEKALSALLVLLSSARSYANDSAAPVSTTRLEGEENTLPSNHTRKNKPKALLQTIAKEDSENLRPRSNDWDSDSLCLLMDMLETQPVDVKNQSKINYDPIRKLRVFPPPPPKEFHRLNSK